MSDVDLLGIRTICDKCKKQSQLS